MKPTFFATPEAVRAWPAKNQAGEKERLVGYYKKGTTKPSVTWPESVGEALGYGWIDGIRKGIDDESVSSCSGSGRTRTCGGCSRERL